MKAVDKAVDKAVARMQRVEDAKMYLAGLKDQIKQLEMEIEVTPDNYNQTNLKNPDKVSKKQKLFKLKLELRQNENAVHSATVDPEDVKKVFG